MASEDDLRLEIENLDLRRLLAEAGIHAAEQKIAERLQRLLLEELHHRVKNTLATVLAITSQSLRTAESLEHGKQAIESRLLALGRVHDLLLQTNWTSAALADIVKAAIAPFDQGGGRFTVQSTNMEVSPGAVLPLAMVLNELCTNAVKYGALSNPTGRVEITATANDAQKQFRTRMDRERGAPCSCAQPSKLRVTTDRAQLRQPTERQSQSCLRSVGGRLYARRPASFTGPQPMTTKEPGIRQVL